MSTIAHVLSTRLLGSGDFDSNVEALNKVLNLQFRIHYHIFVRDDEHLTTTNGEVLMNDLDKLLKGIDNNEPLKLLLQKILFNAMGMIQFHLKNLEQSQFHLTKAIGIKINNSDYEDFDTYLKIENLYYRGLCQGPNLAVYHSELLQILKNKIPKESNGLTFHYLNLIVEKLKDSKLTKVDEIVSLFKKSSDSKLPSGLLCYIILSIFSNDKSSQLDKFYLGIGNEILSSTSFPHADKPNSEQLKQFHIFLHYYFKNTKNLSSDPESQTSSSWRIFITSSIGKTFQSIEVAKTAMFYLGNFGNSTSDKREAILNFVNFSKYNEREFQLKNEDKTKKYDDIVSLIESYYFILKIAKDESSTIENIFNFREVTETMSDLINMFYCQNKVPQINLNEALDWSKLSARVNLPESVASIMTKSWVILYTIRQFDLEFLISNSLLSYLANGICLVIDENSELLLDLQFKYAYTLAQQRHIEPSIKFMKTVVLEKFPESYKTWHLLALCESSIHEDKEVPFKIVCSVLEAMKESFEEDKLSVSERWQFIHLKLTQLSIIEEMFGTLEALDLLPETFQLYTQLFPDNDKRYERMGSEFSQTKEYLLQLIWIFASNMYIKIEEAHLVDAKGAIKEALGVTSEFKNLNCNLANGYLSLSKCDLNIALKEFETVLFYDESNTDAMIGFAELVFPEISEDIGEPYKTEYYSLDDTENQPIKKTQEIFVNEKDKSAAYARLKFLLEYSITKSVEAYHSPEVWWYLSKIYEKYQDNRYGDSLLNCIKYKETSPIRKFKYCNY